MPGLDSNGSFASTVRAPATGWADLLLLWSPAEGTAGAVGDEVFRRLAEHVALALRAIPGDRP